MADTFDNAKFPSSAALLDFFFSIEVYIYEYKYIHRYEALAEVSGELLKLRNFSHLCKLVGGVYRPQWGKIGEKMGENKEE